MGQPTKFLPALLLSIAGATIAAAPSLASPLTYTETATDTGCFGDVSKSGGVITCAAGTNFTDALVTITLTADTGNVTNTSTGLFENVGAAGTVTVSVAGIGSATFTNQVEVFVNQSTMVNGQPASIAGFFDFGVGLDPLDTDNSSFAAYDLTSPIGPISGSPALIAIGQIFPTSNGGFVLTGTPDASTFTAVAVAVPAPQIDRGLPVLLVLVVFGAEFWKRKQKRRSLSS